MKKLVFLLFLVFSLKAYAQAEALKVFLGIPWGLGIHLAQWVSKDNQKVFYVEVTSEGNTLDEAKLSGFQIAVERALGVIVASESEMRNQKLYRDEVITYASGFIDDFQIVDQISKGPKVLLKMQVWVRHSALRDRLLNQSQVSGQIQGGKISAQIESFKNSRESGDKILTSVLLDYPTRAFDIKLGNSQVIVDSSRTSFLRIPFTISWNDSYIKSLQEAIKLINQKPECGRWFSVCKNLVSMILVGSVTGYFDDSVAYGLFEKHTGETYPAIKLTILDTYGNPSFSICYDLPPLTLNEPSRQPFVSFDYGKIEIFPSRSIQSFVLVPLDQLQIKDLDRADLKAVRASACPKGKRY